MFDIAGTGFDVVEFAPGVDLGMVEDRTGAPVTDRTAAYATAGA